MRIVPFYNNIIFRIFLKKNTQNLKHFVYKHRNSTNPKQQLTCCTQFYNDKVEIQFTLKAVRSKNT